MMRYVKLSLVHAECDTAIDKCRAAFLAVRPNAAFSINRNATGALAWVKTTTDADVSVGGSVLDIQDGDNSRAMADTSNPLWSPGEVA